MRVLILGASGLIGRGVLRECLMDSDVSEVKLVGRSKMNPAFHIPTTRLSELVMPDMFDYSKVESELTGFDACFICLLNISAINYLPVSHFFNMIVQDNQNSQ